MKLMDVSTIRHPVSNKPKRNINFALTIINSNTTFLTNYLIPLRFCHSNLHTCIIVTVKHTGPTHLFGSQ